jgi:tetratricopeptide (TPR) repeat protein
VIYQIVSAPEPRCPDLIDQLLEGRVKATLFGSDRAPRLGRLIVLEPIGSGATGTVFAAYDPTLDRKVAVKVLARSDEVANRRILGEARALGKLAHPNVVAVHDADEVAGAVYIVMELAPGVSLREWLAAPRGWREVVATLAGAGAGVAAAHQAGLVHGDIKPENILVGGDRVRVVDFGLARAAREPPARASADGPAELAAVTTPAGTPGYMAPEVLTGSPPTAASDQFSFAVTLFEALYGERPYRAAGSADLPLAAASAASSRRPPRSRVPRWLHDVLRRALAADPADRFATMKALLAELDRDRRRRRLQLATTGAVAAAAVAAILAIGGEPADPCAGADPLDAVRAPSAGTRLRDRLGGAPWSAAVTEQTIASLDRFRAGWGASYRRICEATRVRGEQSDALLDLRMRCLHRQRDRLLVLLDELESADAAAAATAVAALPAPDRCESLIDPGELALPDEPGLRRRVAVAERELDRSWAAYALGRYRIAGARAAALDARTSDLDFAPLRGQVRFLLGSAEARAGDPARARDALLAALGDAAAARSPELEVEIWSRILRGELFAGSRDKVFEWAPFARAAARRAGSGGAEIDGIVAEALRGAGRLGEARRLLEGALSSGEPLREHRRAILEMNLGSVLLLAGDPEEAAAWFSRGLASARTALGDRHPGLALHVDKLATAERDRGRIARALANHAAALELRRQAYGEDDRAVASSLLRGALTRIEAGDLATARRDLERARDIRAAIYGPEHRRLAEIERALGDAAAAAGDDREARDRYRRAAALDETISVASRLVEAGAAIDPASLRPLSSAGDVAVERVSEAAARIERLVASGAGDLAGREAGALAGWWRRAAPGAGAIANRVAEALLVTGDRAAAAEIFATAAAALAPQPSRERARALIGLARTGADPAPARALARALPELDLRLAAP